MTYAVLDKRRTKNQKPDLRGEIREFGSKNIRATVFQSGIITSEPFIRSERELSGDVIMDCNRHFRSIFE
jgi:hypothetical protein